MTKYTDCELCGREIGHWLGCEGAPSVFAGEDETYVTTAEDLEKVAAVMGDHDLFVIATTAEPAAQCGKDDCTNERLPQGKGPRPKYCADHKTRSK